MFIRPQQRIDGLGSRLADVDRRMLGARRHVIARPNPAHEPRPRAPVRSAVVHTRGGREAEQGRLELALALEEGGAVGGVVAAAAGAVPVLAARPLGQHEVAEEARRLGRVGDVRHGLLVGRKRAQHRLVDPRQGSRINPCLCASYRGATCAGHEREHVRTEICMLSTQLGMHMHSPTRLWQMLCPAQLARFMPPSPHATPTTAAPGRSSRGSPGGSVERARALRAAGM